jgi:Lrp/AsnC family leucine-responsive transcriptional regulator
MDDKDRTILEHIQRSGRDSYGEIGAAVDLSVSAVNERLKRLQAQGVIAGWGARIDPARVGRGTLAFVFLRIEQAEAEPEILAALAELPDVQECHRVTGDWTWLVKLRVADLPALERLLAEHPRLRPGMVRTHVMLALSSSKDTGFVPCKVPGQPTA